MAPGGRGQFRVGDEVLVQEIWRGAVWAARPMIVARDEEDLLALWFPQGTAWKAPVPPPAHRRTASRGEWIARCLATGEWVFEDQHWGVSTLSLLRPGAWHALWVSWLDGERMPWYVNLQEPFRRTRAGLETMDLALDVVIHHDRTWYWKDEDELAILLDRGVFDVALGKRIREEGLRMVRSFEAEEPPFSEPWPEWRPDPSWGLPELPVGWGERCR